MNPQISSITLVCLWLFMAFKNHVKIPGQSLKFKYIFHFFIFCYSIDSCDLDVKEFDYEPSTGNICKDSRTKTFSVLILQVGGLFWHLN